MTKNWKLSWHSWHAINLGRHKIQPTQGDNKNSNYVLIIAETKMEKKNTRAPMAENFLSWCISKIWI
jgi:hypothetical protein